MRRGALLAVLLALAPPAEAARATLRAARPGQAPLALEARSTATHWIIRVREGGRERQRIEVTTDLPETAPRLADANGDGAPDLWVPVIGGNADTAWDLWIMQPAEARFRRAGEISGLAFARDGEGRLVALGRDGCCAISYAFYDIAPDGALRALFGIERQLEEPRSCEGSAAAEQPPPALLRAVCALAPGRLPGSRLPVP